MLSKYTTTQTLKRENIIYKTLENCRSIGKIKRHDCLFEKFIVDMEDSFPLIIFYNIHQVIYVTEVRY